MIFCEILLQNFSTELHLRKVDYVYHIRNQFLVNNCDIFFRCFVVLS